jgi:hypothetical protein
VPLTKFVGNITTRGQVINFWNQITPENEGKWSSVEPNRDQMNWAGMDRVRDYARQHGIPYKQHTFVWGAQQPGWIGGLSQSEQRAEVEDWIRLFCERYPDVALIDVVNEPPPHTTPPYLNALGGAGSSGYDWIVQAFRWARQYCPNAILILNDYNTVERLTVGFLRGWVLGTPCTQKPGPSDESARETRFRLEPIRSSSDKPSKSPGRARAGFGTTPRRRRVPVLGRGSGSGRPVRLPRA